MGNSLPDLHFNFLMTYTNCRAHHIQGDAILKLLTTDAQTSG